MVSMKLEPNRRRSLSDPLAVALRPPANETTVEREKRILAEEEAKKVSDGIDAMLQAERKQQKSNPVVKVLLLGQSESGKSTTLKQFQLMHTPASFHAERIAWRTVIYLNLVRSIRRILEAISPEVEPLDEHEDEEGLEPASIIISAFGRPPSAISGTRVQKYEYYRRHLDPLVDLEDRLIRMLSSPDEDEATHLGPFPSNWNLYSDAHYPKLPPSGKNSRPSPSIMIPSRKASSTSPISPLSSITSRSLPSPSKPKNKEVSVHHTSNWKKAFALGGKTKSPKSAHTNEIEGWWDDPDDPVHAINACASVMLELWRDTSVKQRLREKRLRLEESSGFYLNEISRITALRYFPTNEDVLKARLKTVGVVEHTFSLQGNHIPVEWKIYDVGGSRNQRHAWAPYFEDVNAIIFLAPISAFDQVLAEDPEVNRVEDSLLLWQSVISNKLLANVNIVLFLNKCDLLRAKLESGVRLNQHMTTYGDRPNDYESVSKYFRNKFGVLHQTYTPNKERELIIHYTCVTDTHRTATIISTVRDFIVTSNLKDLSFF